MRARHTFAAVFERRVPGSPASLRYIALQSTHYSKMCIIHNVDMRRALSTLETLP